MRVAVGSRNPVKVAAVEAVLDRYEPTVQSVAVDSGVAEQPRSVAETVRGAENRAERAFDALDVETRGEGTGRSDGANRAFGVGIEGGVARLDPPGLWLVMWAAVTDGDRLERGAGPSLRLPDPIADRIDAGEELGPVLDDELGREDVARQEGAAGVLTAGLTDRQEALETAVACAVGPFLVDTDE